MRNREIQICPACNRATEIMFVHGHGQCSFCKTNIDPCCSGETAELKKIKRGREPSKEFVVQHGCR